MMQPRTTGLVASLVAAVVGCGRDSPDVCTALCVPTGIRVTVLDANTGSPIPNPSASIEGSSCVPNSCVCGPASAEAGHLFCAEPAAGSESLVVSVAGYGPAGALATVTTGPPPCRCPVDPSVTALSRLSRIGMSSSAHPLAHTSIAERLRH